MPTCAPRCGAWFGAPSYAFLQLQGQITVKHPHLLAAFLSLCVLGAVILGGVAYAHSVETEYVHTLASKNLPQKRNGIALQRLAFESPDLLPIYGSSELNIPDPYQASKIFMLYPTGFNVFTLSGDGAEPLEYLQMLADVGPGLRGKQVVISLSPQFFIEAEISEDAFRGNFSRLHAYGFALADLPPDLKARVAQRILAHRAAFNADALLVLVLQTLAQDTPLHRAAFAALFPVAKLQETLLEIQDHWAILDYIWNHPEIKPGVTRRPQDLNWSMLAAHAQPYAMHHAGNNPFGIEDTEWKTEWAAYAATHKNDTNDERFLLSLNRSHGWVDLVLLVKTLQAMGAKPLLISLPLHQSFWGYRGVSPAALAKYYDKMNALAAEQQVPVVSFQQFQNDEYFLRDPGAHMSAKGWVHYSQVLDAYFHGRALPEAVGSGH